MTKRRAPLSIDEALVRIAAQISGGYSAMAELVELSSSHVRAWGDPDRREEIPVKHAITLDLAFQEHGGAGAPIFETYAARLELAEVRKFADRIELLAHTAEVIREGGEAHSALVRACKPCAGPAEHRDALAEASEARDVLTRAIAALEAASSNAELARAPP
ncbi:hypothetical protein V5F89_12340 [Pelagerythrobacter marensis]|uniref:Uncharacterized protein n=1 Tax=Pelagerythrobacter marensis TaxID=543877 RepID=A0ABZ2D1W1_9SPHN